MGNYRLKLSDMMPNAWFYKLRDMGKKRRNHSISNINNNNKNHPSSSSSYSTTSKSSKPKQPHQCNNPRKSYYFTRDLIAPTDRINTSPASNPKFSDPNNLPETPPIRTLSPSKRKPNNNKIRTTRISPKLVTTSSSSVSAGCSCRTTLESVWTKSDSPREDSSPSPFDSSGESEFPEPEFRTDRVLLPAAADDGDVVIDVDKNSIATTTTTKDIKKLDGLFDSLSEMELPPIITKPAKNSSKKETKPRRTHEQGNQKVKILKEDSTFCREQRTTHVRRFSVNSPGVRIRVNSPRIGGRRSNGYGGRKSVSSAAAAKGGCRRSLSDSLAVVKSSLNPQRDFRESMVEMIVENNIRASKDLEDLLACYLSLNSDEYHDLIIKVFKQIWFDLTDTN